MNPAVEKMFASATSLPQIPKVVQEVINHLKDEDVDFSRLADKVRQDQVISAKVLRLANSSYYGASGKVATIEDAITLIGLKAFQTLIIASGVVAAFPKIPAFDLSAFWKHSLLVANIARALARHRKLDSELAFTGAMMSGIGILLTYLSFPDGAMRVTESCKGTSVGERKAIERQILQFDHCEVGAELSRRWHFPVEIQDIIANYCTLEKGSAMARLVYASVVIAQGLEVGDGSEKLFSGIDSNLASELSLDLEWFESRTDVFALLLAESASLI
ncbi:MAG TPA: HDOD domain-containing protein [Rhodocyclaceae bacterium]|jgi:putative nucleotidyltransferase with HDIG domain